VIFSVFILLLNVMNLHNQILVLNTCNVKNVFKEQDASREIMTSSAL